MRNHPGGRQEQAFQTVLGEQADGGLGDGFSVTHAPPGRESLPHSGLRSGSSKSR